MKKDKQVSLVYIGHRINGDSVAQTFIDSNEKEYYWSKIKFLNIGNKYKVTKTKTGMQMSRVPEEIRSTEIDQKVLEKWMAEDEAALEYGRRIRASFKAKKFSFKYKTVEELKEIVDSLDTRSKSHFIDRIKMYLLFNIE